MGYRVGAAVVAILAGLATQAGAQASAKTLPAVQLSPSNQPSQCTTPGRLMAFLHDRNPRLAPKFNKIAVEYMRHGIDLGIRWDYAFFQMVVETNSLKYTGDVRPHQNNFAGLGATGGGVRGESFRTVSDGVRAHQQHLMVYAGIHVSNPVADRTRKVQSWRILDKWRSRIRHPITFSDVGAQWAPVDRRYGDDIQAIADAFMSSRCNRPDPAPELLAEATGAMNKARGAGFSSDKRAALGASSVRNNTARAGRPRYKTLNNPAANKKRVAASVGKFAAPAIKPPASTKKCRVWTASYGGQKAIIIRSNANDSINYTVLDVNAGREDAETKAYIAAYAKGGQSIGDFPNKTAAMARAFKLCPEG